MIRTVIKHFQCRKQEESPSEVRRQQVQERKSIFKRLTSLRNRSSTEKNKAGKIDALELEWSNSPKSRLRRNGFDIPVYG